jgi:hypothetical protein
MASSKIESYESELECIRHPALSFDFSVEELLEHLKNEEAELLSSLEMSKKNVFAAIGTWKVYGKAVPIEDALAGFSAGLEQVRAEIAAADEQKKKKKKDYTFSDCIKRLVRWSQPEAFLLVLPEELIDYLKTDLDKCNVLLELHLFLPKTAHLFKELGKSILCNDAAFKGKPGKRVHELRDCRLCLKKQLCMERQEAAMQSLVNQLAGGSMIASSSSCSML